MKTEEIKNLFDKFESIACEYQGVECWSAREMCTLLGYAKWQTFENVLAKAQEACQNAGIQVPDHFTGVSKTIPMPKGASKEPWRGCQEGRTQIGSRRKKGAAEEMISDRQ